MVATVTNVVVKACHGVISTVPRGSHPGVAFVENTIIDLTTPAWVHVIQRLLTEEEVSVLLIATLYFDFTLVLELRLPSPVRCFHISLCDDVFRKWCRLY